MEGEFAISTVVRMTRIVSRLVCAEEEHDVTIVLRAVTPYTLVLLTCAPRSDAILRL